MRVRGVFQPSIEEREYPVSTTHCPAPAFRDPAATDALPPEPANGPAPIVVELVAAPHAWEIRPGHTVAGYAYNARVPGPVIHAAQGVPLEVRFTNALPE